MGTGNGRRLGRAVLGLALVAASPARSGDAADAGEAELQGVRAAPVAALLRLKKAATADCTGIGHYHVVLEVIATQPRRRIRTAHFSYQLTEPHLSPGSLFVVGLTPKRWVPGSHLCLPGSMATDSDVLALFPVKDEAEGRALLKRLRSPRR